MYFIELKKKLSLINEKKATWLQVANFHDIPFFKDKTNRQISMLVSQWKNRGLPSKVKLWIIETQ